MNIIYDSTLTNPYMNIAFERQLSELNNPEKTLFLWQNDNCVVIGRNQNPLAECNLEYMKDNEILLSRRYSGGGAVFHDLGNMNYTLVMKEADYDLEVAKSFLLKTFEYLDLDVEFSGRNDMTIAGSKFSGQAYFAHNGMYVLHGTLLLDLSIDILGKCLTPSKKKLESKGIKSVKSRVINLKDIKEDITSDSVKTALIKSFKDVYGESKEVVRIHETDINTELSRFLQADEWLYSKSPKFNLEIEKRFSFGNFVLQIEIKKNIISQIKIYTDSLNTSFVELENTLKDMLYDENKIWDMLERYALTL